MDKAMTTKVAAVAVVVVIVVAALMAFFALGNDNGGNGGQSGDSAGDFLQILGNADENAVINENDVYIIDQIISGKAKLSDYPMADANNDGKVDQADLELVNGLISKKEGTTVYVRCLDNKGNDVAVPVTYPLRNVVVFATNMELATVYAGGGPYVAGYFTKSYANAEASMNPAAVNLEGTQRQISDASWANFTKLDSDLQGNIGALLVDDSAISQITDQRYGDLNAAGIPMISLKVANPDEETKAICTLSFLFGKKTESIGPAYVELYEQTVATIDNYVSGVPSVDRPTFMSFTMWIYVCQNDSSFNQAGSIVGGMPYYKVNSAFASEYAGSGSTKMQSTEALANYTDVDFLINNRSIDWQDSVKAAHTLIVDSWTHSNSGVSSEVYYQEFLNKLYYVNNVLPGVVKLAYIAAAFYGDSIGGMTWADSVLQKCIDNKMGTMGNYTIEQLVPYFDYSMYLEYSQ